MTPAITDFFHLAAQKIGARISAKRHSLDAFLVFNLITVVYIVCEFSYNRVLLDLASEAPSQAAMHTIEWIGRTMAGVGCAIIVWRSINARAQRKDSAKKGFRWMGFTFCVAFSIPMMWGLQEALINSLVTKASPDTVRSALLVMTGREAYRPHSNPSSSDISTEQNNSVVNRKVQTKHQVAVIGCTATLKWTQTEAMMNYSKTFWALFGVLSLSDAASKQRLLETSAQYAACTVAATPDIVRQRYAEYSKSIVQLEQLNTQYQEASEQMGKYLQSRWSSPDRAKAMWRGNIDKFFGFGTTIDWGLSQAQFNAHPDVLRLAAEKSNQSTPLDLPIGMSLDEFAHALSLGNTATLTASVNHFEARGRWRGQAESAYKALLVPLIGLSLSLFFGIFNSVMLALGVLTHAVGRQLKSWPYPAFALFLAIAPFYITSPLVATSQYIELVTSAKQRDPMLAAVVNWTVHAQSILDKQTSLR